MGARKGQRAAFTLGKPVFLARGSVSALPNMPINAHYAHLQRSELLAFGAVRNLERLWGGIPIPKPVLGKLRAASGRILPVRNLKSPCTKETFGVPSGNFVPFGGGRGGGELLVCSLPFMPIPPFMPYETQNAFCRVCSIPNPPFIKPPLHITLSRKSLNERRV